MPGAVVEGDDLRSPGHVLDRVADLEVTASAQQVTGLDGLAVEQVGHLHLERQLLREVADGPKLLLAVDVEAADHDAVLDLESAEAVEVAQSLRLDRVAQVDGASALHRDLLVDTGDVDLARCVEVGLHRLRVGHLHRAIAGGGRRCRCEQEDRGHRRQSGDDGGESSLAHWAAPVMRPSRSAVVPESVADASARSADERCRAGEPTGPPAAQAGSLPGNRDRRQGAPSWPRPGTR